VCLGSDYEVTRVGLSHLAACAPLTRLTLGNFNISPPTPDVRPPLPPHPADSQAQQGFPALAHLEVRGCHMLAALVTDVPAAFQLSHPPQLPDALMQFGGSFFNRGLRHVFPLGPRLSHIHATTTSAVHDAFMPHLARQTSLTSLSLHGGYQLTVAGVRALTSLPHLKTLELSACPQVTKEALGPVLSQMKSPPMVVFLTSGPVPPPPSAAAGSCTSAASPLTHSSSLPSLSAYSSGSPSSSSSSSSAGAGASSGGGAAIAHGPAGCSMP
jgi:hypothetical protein